MTMDLILISVLLISVYTDLRFQKIYNAVLFPAALIALLSHLISNGLTGLLFSLKGLGLGLALFMLPFIMGGLGAGDVKLLALVGSVKGPAFVFNSFLITALLGGLIAAVLLLFKGRLFKTIKQVCLGFRVFFSSRFTVWNFAALESSQDTLTLPYGVAIALGTILSYWVIM